MTSPRNTVVPADEEKRKEQPQSRFEKFARSTDMHGFIQIAEAKTLPERVFWIVAMVACVGFLIYTSYLMIEADVHAEYRSDIEANRDIRIPVLEFCPAYWMSAEKAHAKGLNKGDISAFMCLLAESKLGTICDDKVKDRYERLRLLLLSWPGTVDMFLQSLAFDYDQVLGIAHQDSRFEVKENYTSVVLPYGVCYVLNINNDPPILTPLTMDIILHNISHSAVEFPEYKIRVHFQMKDQEFGDPFGGPDSFTPLSTELSYQMRYNKIQIEYINRKGKPCANDLGAESGKSYVRCISDCLVRFCVMNDLKPTYIGGYDFTFHEIFLAGDNNSCDETYEGFQQVTRSQINNCEAACLLPCKRMLFNFSPSLTGIVENQNSTKWTVVVEQGKTKFTMKETKPSNWMNGISGMLSLWLGASVLSLVHVIAFLFSCK